MLKIKQSIGNTDATVMTSLHVVGRAGSAEAEIGNMTAMAGASALYEHVRSIPTSVSADPKERRAIWMNWLENEIEARYETTGGSLEIIADVLQMGLETPFYFDFASIHIVAEGEIVKGQSFAFTRTQCEHLRRFIEQLGVKMGLDHPDLAATAAVLVVEETILRTQMTGSAEEAQTARLLFQCLQHA